MRVKILKVVFRNCIWGRKCSDSTWRSLQLHVQLIWTSPKLSFTVGAVQGPTIVGIIFHWLSDSDHYHMDVMRTLSMHITRTSTWLAVLMTCAVSWKVFLVFKLWIRFCFVFGSSLLSVLMFSLKKTGYNLYCSKIDAGAWSQHSPGSTLINSNTCEMYAEIPWSGPWLCWYALLPQL